MIDKLLMLAVAAHLTMILCAVVQIACGAKLVNLSSEADVYI